jgi:RimJ/RimL family protein N-acetyltransferase
MIHPKYWGSGVAIEIAKSTSQIFLKHSGFDKVYVRILDENKKSLGLNYKIGAKFVATEKLITGDGIEKDCHILEIAKIEDEIEIYNWKDMKTEEDFKKND